MILYLLLGCLMDSLAMIFLTIPVFFPVIVDAGIDPVWFGIFAVIVVEFGLVSPPVGMNLFLSAYRFNEPMPKIYKATLPFFLIKLLAVGLITYIPILTLGLFNF